MKHRVLSFTVGVTTMLLAACWTDIQQIAAEPHAPAGGMPAAHPAGDLVPGSGQLKDTTGTVVETMNAGGYTYVQVDDGAKKMWAAAPQFAVTVGSKVVVPEGVPMQDFYSKTLERTFDVVYFVPGIQVVGGEVAKEQVAAAHGTAAKTPAAALDFSNIRKADGGHTVAELFADKTTLAGHEVAVRGRVVKFTPAVMGKNWIHVQDGTGDGGANDLTVATSAAAAVGDTVLVRGKLSTDKDFGFGYHYSIIIEDATVVVE